MPLASGQSILHYRLVDKVGQGGMGEVWRATDTKLDRDVALKFLPGTVTHDTERLGRFAREAKTLASLDHPGIASIHGIEEHEGHRFLVMELVAGQDLSEVLESGPLPLPDVLAIAVQIARAVETAHAQGVVHRDLKPANVKRTPGGEIKVLDFGLAKVLGPEVSSGGTDVGSPTITSAGTAAGVILGTAAYMSPEQARGRPVDKRTDIWSFGVVLYELLTGGNPFRGETVADSVGAILHRDPDLTKLPPDTPSAARRVLRRCLERKRSQRLHDIADARIELEEAIANPEAEAMPAAGAPSAARPPSRAPWIALAVLLPIVAATAWWIGSREEPMAAPAVRTFELVPDGEPDEVVLSPDGTRLAYVLDGKLFLRALDSLEPRELTEQGSRQIRDLFWSPDGRSLGMIRTDGALERIDLGGGAPISMSSEGLLAGSPQWAEDGYIYFDRFQSGIQRIPESGGAPEIIIPRREELVDYHGVSRLPGGRGFLTVPHHQDGEYRRIFLERPGEAPVVVFESDSSIARPIWSATGHVLFFREDSPRGLWATPFSLESLRTDGDPFLVMPDLDRASLSDRGDMVYTKAALQRGKQKQELVWLDRDGEKVGGLAIPLYGAVAPAMSPDGTRIALPARGVGRPSTDKTNLWVIDVERGSASKLTESGIAEARPTWSEDGKRIAVLRKASGMGGDNELLAFRADGSGEPETVFAADISFQADLDRDWSWAAFMTGAFGAKDGMAIARLRVDDPSTLATVVDGPEQDVMQAIHPDGDWIAYASGTFAAFDTYVQRFPDGEGRYKASIDEGGIPFWSPDGTSLYYIVLSPSRGESPVMEVTFDDSRARPVLGRPTRLFTTPDPSRWMSVTPDGHFLILDDIEPEEGEEAPDTTGIVLVQNWLSRFSK